MAEYTFPKTFANLTESVVPLHLLTGHIGGGVGRLFADTVKERDYGSHMLVDDRYVEANHHDLLSGQIASMRLERKLKLESVLTPDLLLLHLIISSLTMR